MSTTLEAITVAYGQPPSKSYFEGCSNGGREALMNVQRYPNLFDGVIARAPAYNWVGFMGAFNRTAKALAAPGGAFSPAKTALLAKSVLDACDGFDGIVDGVVSNQAACTPAVFDPASLRCQGGADTGDGCLSDAQLAVVDAWTTDAVFTGEPTFRNAGWSLTGNEDSPTAFGLWVSGNGAVTNALQFLFQDTTVKNKAELEHRILVSPQRENCQSGSNRSACSDGLDHAGFAARFTKTAKPRPARYGDST
jgi:hypothetical protein